MRESSNTYRFYVDAGNAEKAINLAKSEAIKNIYEKDEDAYFGHGIPFELISVQLVENFIRSNE